MEKFKSNVLQYLIPKSRLLFSLIPPVMTDNILYVTIIFNGQIGKRGIPPMGIKPELENAELRI